jgi:hypothetical protein
MQKGFMNFFLHACYILVLQGWKHGSIYPNTVNFLTKNAKYLQKLRSRNTADTTLFPSMAEQAS